MSRRSSSSRGISLFTILIWLVFGYAWFHDSNSDKKNEVEIRKPSVTVEQTVSKKDTEIDIRGVKKELTEALTKAKEELLKTKDRVMEEVNKQSSKTPVEEPEKEEGPAMTAEPETKPEEPSKPLNEKPVELEMKKL